VLVAGNVMPPVPVFAALPIAAVVGASSRHRGACPALRLRTFYFAMSTLGFATIVTQIALACRASPAAASASPVGISRAVQHRLGLLFLCLRLLPSPPGSAPMSRAAVSAAR